jgi:hypothetical protein
MFGKYPIFKTFIALLLLPVLLLFGVCADPIDGMWVIIAAVSIIDTRVIVNFIFVSIVNNVKDIC